MKKLFLSWPVLLILSIPGFWFFLVKLFKWLDIFEGFVLFFNHTIPDNFFLILLFYLSSLLAAFIIFVVANFWAKTLFKEKENK
jgi:hypothetical protein|tara:strand:+ start:736 stop:987 length:252 start_codon:yes stop_codon:yes gene_type:complete